MAHISFVQPLNGTFQIIHTFSSSSSSSPWKHLAHIHCWMQRIHSFIHSIVRSFFLSFFPVHTSIEIMYVEDIINLLCMTVNALQTKCEKNLKQIKQLKVAVEMGCLVYSRKHLWLNCFTFRLWSNELLPWNVGTLVAQQYVYNNTKSSLKVHAEHKGKKAKCQLLFCCDDI